MSEEPRRPDPDALLRKLQQQERPSRGRLRIYLGAAPGVGKTYAMLNEGRRRIEAGEDVVIGIVETHGRAETARATEGLPLIPRRKVAYQGVELEEMDLDAVLARKPSVVMVDELAHTNAPGSRNTKRWQDVQELLAAGIDVVSTVNVQHLESLRDVVAGITGVQVQETLPDAIVDDADEVELVDVSPETLQSRMRGGNIYPTEQARRALESFFRTGNLVALRELALKRVASEVGQDLVEYMREHRLEGWESGETVLAYLDNVEAGQVVVRRAWRLANALDAPLIAAYPASLARQAGAVHLLTTVHDLNARSQELPGESPLDDLGKLIAEENVGHVVMAVRPPRMRLLPRGAPLHEQLLARFRHIDLHLVGADAR